MEHLKGASLGQAYSQTLEQAGKACQGKHSRKFANCNRKKVYNNSSFMQEILTEVDSSVQKNIAYQIPMQENNCLMLPHMSNRHWC